MLKMHPLPFYEVLAELIKPTPLVNHGQYSAQEALHLFSLSSTQNNKIHKSRQLVQSTVDGVPRTTIQYSTQVQLRFWTNESLSKGQDDLLPAELLVKINDEAIHAPPPSIPRIPCKRPTAQAFDITTNVMHFASHFISMEWFAEPEHNFLFSVNLVRKQTAQELFSTLMTKPVKPAHSSQALVKELTSKGSEDEELCCPTSLRVSLTCPLGKSRMSYPTRGVNCKHLQCFDANSFLMMNEKKSSFLCPVCSLRLKFSELCIDGYFMDIIKNLSNKQSGNDVELFPDGSWLPVCGQSPATQTSNKKSPSEPIIEIIDLDDENDENEIFIINQVSSDPSSSFQLFSGGVQRSSSRRNSLLGEINQINAFDSSFRLFACGIEKSSSRRNSLCEEITQVIQHEPEVINLD